MGITTKKIIVAFSAIIFVIALLKLVEYRENRILGRLLTEDLQIHDIDVSFTSSSIVEEYKGHSYQITSDSFSQMLQIIKNSSPGEGRKTGGYDNLIHFYVKYNTTFDREIEIILHKQDDEDKIIFLVFINPIKPIMLDYVDIKNELELWFDSIEFIDE